MIVDTRDQLCPKLTVQRVVLSSNRAFAAVRTRRRQNARGVSVPSKFPTATGRAVSGLAGDVKIEFATAVSLKVALKGA